MPLGASTIIMPKTVRFNALLSAAFFALTLVVPGSVAAQTNSVINLSINGFGETSFGITPNYLAMGGTGIANVIASRSIC